MATNTLTEVAVGDAWTIDDENQTVRALKGDVVPRNASGVAQSGAGSLGSPTFPWANVHTTLLTVNGTPVTGRFTPSLIYQTASPAAWSNTAWIRVQQASANVAIPAGRWWLVSVSPDARSSWHSIISTDELRAVTAVAAAGAFTEANAEFIPVMGYSGFTTGTLNTTYVRLGRTSANELQISSPVATTIVTINQVL